MYELKYFHHQLLFYQQTGDWIIFEVLNWRQRLMWLSSGIYWFVMLSENGFHCLLSNYMRRMSSMMKTILHVRTVFSFLLTSVNEILGLPLPINGYAFKLYSQNVFQTDPTVILLLILWQEAMFQILAILESKNVILSISQIRGYTKNVTPC